MAVLKFYGLSRLPLGDRILKILSSLPSLALSPQIEENGV